MAQQIIDRYSCDLYKSHKNYRIKSICTKTDKQNLNFKSYLSGDGTHG